MNLPERIVAIGGAGKDIGLTLLEQEWVLESVLEPRPNPPSMKLTIIDTAEGEENEDRQRIQDVRERIHEYKQEARELNQGRPGNIEIDYQLITKNIQLNGTIDLLGESVVPRIAAGNGMDEENWWLEEEHVNENLDFARGVLRKRALGKSIYYKAYAEDDRISAALDLPDKGKIALILGLGGGTGSGLFLDLARRLQERQRTAEITLFGVLPNHNEGPKVSANAYAALSELEYLSLTGEPVFKDRILLPIDPTGFDGKRGDRIKTVEPLKEFDEAIVYLIAAYYNTQNLEDPFTGTPVYAPFTIGIPQVLRYNVEAIQFARGSLSDLLDLKEDALRAEENIYDSLERFLARHYDEDEERGIREADRADLESRFEKVEQLLEFDLFEELDYESLSIFESIIEDSRTEAEDIEDQIDILSQSLRAVDTTGRQANAFVDRIDEHLAEIMEQDLKLIKRRKELLASRQSVDDKRIRDAIEYLMDAGDGTTNPGVVLQRLETELGDLDDKQAELKRELENAHQELENLRDEQSERIEREVGQWQREIEGSLDQIETMADQSVRSDVQGLNAKLDEFVSAVASADTPDEVDQVRQSDIDELLERLENELDAIGVEFQTTRRDISASMADLKQCRKAFLGMKQEEGLLDQLTPWTTSTEENRKESQKDFRMQKNKIDDRGIFGVGSSTASFEPGVKFDGTSILSDYETRERQLRMEVIDELRERTDELPEDVANELEAVVEGAPDRDRLRELAIEAFERGLSGTAEIERRTTELEEELDGIEDKREQYDAVTVLFEDQNARREEYVDKLAEFDRERSDYGEHRTGRVSTGQNAYKFVKEIQPSDVFRTTGESDIKRSEILKDRNEAERVREYLEELAANARGEQYTSLRRRKLSKDGRRYEDLKIRVGVLSKAVNDIQPDALQFRDLFEGAFDLGARAKSIDSPYTTWKYEAGGDWDIGLAVFIDGVFLDNIRKVVQANGYRIGYQRQLENESDIIVHHGYGLEDGYYLRRRDVLNIEDPTDVEFYLRDEPSVVDDLKNYHEVISHVDDVRPSERGTVDAGSED